MQWWLTSFAAIRVTHCDGNTRGKKKKIKKKKRCREEHYQSDALCSAPQHALHQQQVGQVGQNMKRKQNKDAPPLRQIPAPQPRPTQRGLATLGMARYRPSNSSARRPQKKLTESNKHTTQSASRNTCTNWYTQSKSKLEEVTHATRAQNNPARTPITRKDISKTDKVDNRTRFTEPRNGLTDNQRRQR